MRDCYECGQPIKDTDIYERVSLVTQNHEVHMVDFHIDCASKYEDHGFTISRKVDAPN